MAARRPAPLRRNWFHILIALSRGQAHGYAVMKQVEADTDGALRLWPATLYGALQDLVAAGLIAELPVSRAPAPDSRERRTFRITEAGRRAVREEAARLDALVDLARDAGSRAGS